MADIHTKLERIKARIEGRARPLGEADKSPFMQFFTGTQPFSKDEEKAVRVIAKQYSKLTDLLDETLSQIEDFEDAISTFSEDLPDGLRPYLEVPEFAEAVELMQKAKGAVAEKAKLFAKELELRR